MRNPHNAAWDVLNELGMLQTTNVTVVQDTPTRWLLTFEAIPESPIRSRLHVEVLEEDMVACVLDRLNVSCGTMTRMMNKLMKRLERPPRSSQPSPPPPSPVPLDPSLPDSDTDEPPAGDRRRRRR